MLALLTGCATNIAAGTSAKGAVSVAYAGSLVNLMEHKLGPSFDSATGYSFQGRAAGSTALANQIKSKLISPDVFISASAASYKPLQGAANGDLVRWYLTFATTSMVIGYSPKSQFAAQLQAAASGQTPWYQALQIPGLRLGRTDPKLDPKGINTLYTLQLAEQYYHQPGLAQKLTGGAENPDQIFPEEELVARLTAGQLDAGFFYLNEVKDAGLSYITLPEQINLGDPSLASAYAQASYTTAAGVTQRGAPIAFSVTIPATVRNEAGAEAFVEYLLGKSARETLSADGFAVMPPKLTGDPSRLPSALKSYLGV
ncbi:MAG TPA: extracellular solute-binding protein [Ktedonobacterales bacterium]|nr:extracellular solute-binding protein [Ktedonobacterales bacterium]